jgi:hypothetical protein
MTPSGIEPATFRLVVFLIITHYRCFIHATFSSVAYVILYIVSNYRDILSLVFSVIFPYQTFHFPSHVAHSRRGKRKEGKKEGRKEGRKRETLLEFIYFKSCSINHFCQIFTVLSKIGTVTKERHTCEIYLFPRIRLKYFTEMCL